MGIYDILVPDNSKQQVLYTVVFRMTKKESDKTCFKIKLSKVFIFQFFVFTEIMIKQEQLIGYRTCSLNETGGL